MLALERQGDAAPQPPVDPPVQQAQVQPALELRVVGRRLAVVAGRRLQEVDAEDRAGHHHAGRQAEPGEGPLQPLRRGLRQPADSLVGGWGHRLQGDLARGQGEGVGVERPRLGDPRPLAGIVEGHDLLAPPEDRSRGAAGDDLAEAGQVRAHAEVLLHPAGAHAEADDLVEDEGRPGAVGCLAHPLEEALFGQGQPRRGGQGIDDDGRQPAAVLGEKGLDRAGVVEGQDHHVLQGRRGETRRRGHGMRCRGGPEIRADRRQVAHHGVVVDAVEGALELGRARAAGEGAGGSQGVDHGLGPGAAEPQPLQRRQPPADELRHLHLEGGGAGEPGAPAHGRPQGGDHRGMGVSEDEGGVVVDEVEQPVAVDVVQPDALAALRVQGKGRHVHAGARVAAGEGAGGAGEDRRRARVALDEDGLLLGEGRGQGRAVDSARRGQGHGACSRAAACASSRRIRPRGGGVTVPCRPA